MEIGPFRLKDQDTLEYNPGAWNEFANVLFVDNPVGTGFSSVDTNAYTHDLVEMADQFLEFLEQFFKIFPEYDADDVSYSHSRERSSDAPRSISLESRMLVSIFLISPRPSLLEIKSRM